MKKKTTSREYFDVERSFFKKLEKLPQTQILPGMYAHSTRYGGRSKSGEAGNMNIFSRLMGINTTARGHLPTTTYYRTLKQRRDPKRTVFENKARRVDNTAPHSSATKNLHGYAMPSPLFVHKRKFTGNLHDATPRHPWPVAVASTPSLIYCSNRQQGSFRI